ncbi:hypothetical protein [Nostoc phage A1]|uniref:Uncharacterized protein n=1 Tax=Nostoc phage A1 TaxID=1775256 RepID=A0ACD6B8V9_9CAUD|nr:hypothetical protein [Nostoc phage A1]
MLYSNLINVKQKVISIREKLGDPRLKSLVFEYPAGQLFRVTPKLKVSMVPKNMIGLPLDSKSNITISADDYYITDVSRNVPEAAFRTRAWLDPVINDSGVIVSGINCRCHVINDKSGLSYDLILRKEREVRV